MTDRRRHWPVADVAGMLPYPDWLETGPTRGSLMDLRDYTFLGTTRSLCPHCRRLVDAKIIVRDRRVYFRKHCPEHGRVEDLVEKRYIRAVPVDPITESTETWVIVPVPSTVAQGTVYDVKSGAKGNTADGKPFENL